MKGLKDTLRKVSIGSSLALKNLSGADCRVVSTTVSQMNSDYSERQYDGEDTTLTMDKVRDDVHRCFHVIVTRHQGVLPKKGNRFVKPLNPLLAD